MQQNPLGETGLTVSAVSFGTAPLGDMFGVADESEATADVQALSWSSGLPENNGPGTCSA